MKVLETEEPPRATTNGAHSKNRPVAKPPKKTPLFHRPAVVIVAALLLLFGIVYGATAVFHSFTHESTDDAFIDAHIVAIAPKVAGRVADVHVHDNQEVKQGDPLVEIDPADAEAALAQKRAALEAARAKQRNAEAGAAQADAHLGTVHAAFESAGATAKGAAADLKKTVDDLARNQHLVATGAISKQDYEHSQTDTQSSQATFESREKQVNAAEAYLKEAEKSNEAAHVQVEAAKAEVTQAEAAEHEAELTTSYAKMAAPEDGRVTNKAVEPGSYVQVGQNLLALVTPERWVTANFKETQLRDVRVGQPVSIHVDAYPKHELRGHVDSIQAGSGARFSLLPPENATGNYVKVVQRVPVKIVFDEQPDVKRVLGPGMSAVPDVKVSAGLGAALTVAVIAAILVALVVIGAALWIGRIRLQRA